MSFQMFVYAAPPASAFSRVLTAKKKAHQRLYLAARAALKLLLPGGSSIERDPLDSSSENRGELSGN